MTRFLVAFWCTLSLSLPAHAVDPPPLVPDAPAVSPPAPAGTSLREPPLEPPDIPPGPEVRLSLTRGTAAPFEGVLLDPATMVRWTNRILWLQNQLRAQYDAHLAFEEATRVSYERYSIAVEQSHFRETEWQNAERERLIQEAERLRTRITALERRPPHRAFAIGFGLGAGAILLSTLVGVWIGH